MQDKLMQAKGGARYAEGRWPLRDARRGEYGGTEVRRYSREGTTEEPGGPE